LFGYSVLERAPSNEEAPSFFFRQR
jgi:hypothetical protein